MDGVSGGGGRVSEKFYLTRDQLAERVGSWTEATVSRLIEKRVLRENEHFFLDPRGRGYLFRWDRVVDVIESAEARSALASPSDIPMLAGGLLGHGQSEGKARGL